MGFWELVDGPGPITGSNPGTEENPGTPTGSIPGGGLISCTIVGLSGPMRGGDIGTLTGGILGPIMLGGNPC